MSTKCEFYVDRAQLSQIKLQHFVDNQQIQMNMNLFFQKLIISYLNYNNQFVIN